MLQVEEKVEEVFSQAKHRTLSVMNKLVSVNNPGPTASLFWASLTLAATLRIEVQPGVQVSNTKTSAVVRCTGTALKFYISSANSSW